MDMFYLIPLFPLAGAFLNGVLGIRFFPKRLVHMISVSAVAASLALSIAGLVALVSSPGSYSANLFTWVTPSAIKTLTGAAMDFAIDFSFSFDSLSAVMCIVVTGVGLLIHIYSIGYMHDDPGYARFFAYLNLFSAAMLILVLASNLAVMFIGWEGVGLCSYLLIGFWFDKDSAADAGKKAFITNRVGDFGFLLGTAVIIYFIGTVDFPSISAGVKGGLISKDVATAAALLLFLGATGKSAQIPLYTWLPDAMEGPTPVSALIHAATMVTAGVYMVARMHVLFTFSGTALAVVAVVGAATAVYSATMGFVQFDIKRVLAYSTISQIGYMFIGLGVGAYTAGVFHLMTHAFFKSLLFLSAGSVIHALSGEQDMRNMGGLREKIPATFRVFLAGALAIAGVPGLSGFFSKDEILAAAFSGGHYGIWAAGLVCAGMTAFYMFRLIFMTFWGRPRMTEEKVGHVHESPKVMLVPLAILAFFSITAGFIGLPHVLGGGNWFGEFLSSSTGHAAIHLDFTVEMILMALSVSAGLIGIFTAYVVYVKKEGLPAEWISSRLGPVYRLVYNKYLVDEFYNGVIVKGVMSLGTMLSRFDLGVIDGMVNGVAFLTKKVSSISIGFDTHVVDRLVNLVAEINDFFSARLGRVQTGRVYDYALAAAIGLFILLSLAIIL